MSYSIKLILQDQKGSFDVELLRNTTLNELLDFLKNENYINIQIPVLIYSNHLQKNLIMNNLNAQLQEFLGDITMDIFSIYNDSKYQSNQEVKLLTLFIESSHDGLQQSKFTLQIQNVKTLENVAEMIYQYYQFEQGQVAVDLFLFNQPYNVQEKRNKTLFQLNILDKTTIVSKIRFIGGQGYF